MNADDMERHVRELVDVLRERANIQLPQGVAVLVIVGSEDEDQFRVVGGGNGGAQTAMLLLRYYLKAMAVEIGKDAMIVWLHRQAKECQAGDTAIVRKTTRFH